MNITLTADVERRILDDIKSGRYSPAKKLPTLKQLCLLYGASEITLRNAIRNLCHANVLNSRQGSGIYVIEKKRKVKATVAIFLPSAEAMRNNTVSRTYFTSLDELIVKHNKRSEYQYNLWVSGEPPSPALFKSLNFDGAIFLDRTISGEMLSYLKKMNLANVVSGGVPEKSRGLNFTDYDHRGIMRKCIDRLTQDGHEKIGCFIRNPLNKSVVRDIEQYFYGEMFRRSLQISKAQLAVVDSSEQIIEAYEAMSAAEKDMTAIYCRGPLEADALYDHLIHNGVRVPEDISLIAYGFSDLCPNTRNISAYHADINRYAEAHLCSIRNQLESGNAEGTIILEAEWNEGRTLKSACLNAAVG